MTATTIGLRDRARTARAPLPVARRLLADGWRGLLGWTVGIAAVLALYLPLYPSMRSPELQKLLDSLPPELIRTLGYDDLSSGAGYAQATYFGLLGFVLLTIAAVAWAAAATGGAEESGRLELVLAHGVGRVQYAAEAAVAVLVRILALGVASGLIIWALDRPSELDLDPGKLAGTVIAWCGLGAFSAAAAFLGGAVSGRRIVAIGAGAGVAVVGYALQALAHNSPDLEALGHFSPYEWAFGSAPLLHGPDGGGLALLWAGTAALFALAAAALSRRDILG